MLIPADFKRVISFNSRLREEATMGESAFLSSYQCFNSRLREEATIMWHEECSDLRGFNSRLREEATASRGGRETYRVERRQAWKQMNN